jgi:hypothetical protein
MSSCYLNEGANYFPVKESAFFAITSGVPVATTSPPPLTIRILFALFLFSAALFCSIVLIFIREIPFLFYSKKTQEMVFDPIRSDWRDECLEAKTQGTIMDGVLVNIRYSFAFIGAMLAKSPIGELFEFVGKRVM